MTEHEDIELGRCVLHHTGVGCTKSYEMGTLFKNNYNVEETDSEGLKPVFEEVAGHSGIVFIGFYTARFGPLILDRSVYRGQNIRLKHLFRVDTH